jgi:glutamate-5-semialdehyde dehydrogenase
MDCTPVFKKVMNASKSLLTEGDEKISSILLSLATEVEKNIETILDGNKKDLRKMKETDPRFDRLMLTDERIKAIAQDIRNVASLPDPTGEILSEVIRPNGLSIKRVSVPFGVIGIVYEARPNVTLDVFSLCLKSHNACILKGGSDAVNSNKALVKIIKSVLAGGGLDINIIELLPPGRHETIQLLKARGYVDLIIPRGSSGLINYVRENASIPVIETGAGICHTYFDEYGDREKGRSVVNNAKTRRVSVCNALDCLIIHESRLKDLDYIVGLCSESGVIIYADRKAYRALHGKYPGDLLQPAAPESFGTEFLSYKMAVKSVRSIDEAMNHIAEFGSKHSEAIISENHERINLFLKMVDASSVFSNTSTAFTDGAQFGLGAEIGISTQKLHARGPMALEELTTYKWIIMGDGHVRK